jgi:hypothetical protein
MGIALICITGWQFFSNRSRGCRFCVHRRRNRPEPIDPSIQPSTLICWWQAGHSCRRKKDFDAEHKLGDDLQKVPEQMQ